MKEKGKGISGCTNADCMHSGKCIVYETTFAQLNEPMEYRSNLDLPRVGSDARRLFAQIQEHNCPNKNSISRNIVRWARERGISKGRIF